MKEWKRPPEAASLPGSCSASWIALRLCCAEVTWLLDQPYLSFLSGCCILLSCKICSTSSALKYLRIVTNSAAKLLFSPGPAKRLITWPLSCLGLSFYRAGLPPDPSGAFMSMGILSCKRARGTPRLGLNPSWLLWP